MALGELTDGIAIFLDALPKKYDGLDGTELAISESQERMAVVVSAQNAASFIEFAGAENLEATIVADVTAEKRLKMFWREQVIVDLQRDFLNTNGVKQKSAVKVVPPVENTNYFNALPEIVQRELPDLRRAWLANLSDLNVCSQKGLIEQFDSTIGAGTVLMPLGGKYQATPAEGMVAKIPVLDGETTTASIMTYGYHPQLAKWSPFHGAMYAVVEAVAKSVALGGDYQRIRLSLQEYFEKLGQDAGKWGKPFSALLGAFYAQKELGIPAIGGKDSMSGTYKDLHVPPTLVAFAVNVLEAAEVVSQEFKKSGSKVILFPLLRKADETPDFMAAIKNFKKIKHLIQTGKVLASYTVKGGGLAEAVTKMSFGNGIGMVFENFMEPKSLFTPEHGSIVVEAEPGPDLEKLLSETDYKILGFTQTKEAITVNGIDIDLQEALKAWEAPLENIFPTKTERENSKPKEMKLMKGSWLKPVVRIAKPRIFIPVFPGTNCEYDSARAFEKAGGLVEIVVFRNLKISDLEQSLEQIVKSIKASQIIMLPGGFSAGDEPDGSGKFIAAIFRNPHIKEAVMEFIKQRDGLMLGICNGFQALIKLGLLPYGELREMTADSPTLTFNEIGRHVSHIAQTKIVSTISPWFANVEVGEMHMVPISHGEGRFVARKSDVAKMMEKGQVATQYVDFSGNPTYNSSFNLNGSLDAIEGITSPDGRILGKMGHSERVVPHVAVNVPGNKEQRIFEAGVDYFK